MNHRGSGGWAFFGRLGVVVLMAALQLSEVEAAKPAKPATPVKPVKSSKPAAPPVPVSEIRWLTAPVQKASKPTDEFDLPECLRIRRTTRDSTQITLYVSVLDRSGEPVTGLQRSDIRLYVNDREQSPTGFKVMADLPTEHLAMVLALGLSDRPQHAPLALDAFSSAFVAELEETKSDLCALLTFRGRIAVPLLFSADPLLLKQVLSRIHFSGEGLYLEAAVLAARTLIYQNDTTGYGVVVLAFDEVDSLGSLRRAGDPSEGPSVYALGIDLPVDSSLGTLVASSRQSGGEVFVATPDSLALRSAAGRIIRILQGQYVLRADAPGASKVRVEYAGAGTHPVLSDSVVLFAGLDLPVAKSSHGRIHPDLVRKSLWIGAALLALIIALHLRNRA
jgi:hypothetical protein